MNRVLHSLFSCELGFYDWWLYFFPNSFHCTLGAKNNSNEWSIRYLKLGARNWYFQFCNWIYHLNKTMKCYPEASKSLVGFQAHMNTSDSWPRNTCALLLGISTPTSTSICSAWLAKPRKKENCKQKTCNQNVKNYLYW